MMIEKYPTHCSQCGAPLTQKQGKTYCEYCGYVFLSASSGHKREITEETIENVSSQKNTDTDEFPSHWLKQINVSTGADYNQEEPEQSSVISKLNDYIELGKMLLYVAIFVFVITMELLSAFHTHRKTPDENNSNTGSAQTTYMAPTKTAIDETNRKATETPIHKLSLIELIYQGIYNGVVYPAAGNEDQPVATAVVLEYADANNLVFSLFVYNQSGKDIDPLSLQEHLEIDSLAVTDDLQDEFICSLQKDNWDESFFLKNRSRRKGMINCSGSLNPESSLIIIDFDMPNWGSSHLEIPIQTDNEELQSSMGLKLAPESYSISAEIHSEQPQLVWVKKSDISIINDRGITLLLDGCTPTASQQGADEYFLTLTYPSGYNERLFDEKLITCEYDEPFPSEINTMSASLKTTSGKIFKSQAVVNKSEGTIQFTNETDE